MVKEINKFSELKRPTVAEVLGGIFKLEQKQHELTEYEHIMKNVAQCSKSVRNALLITKNTGLALCQK